MRRVPTNLGACFAGLFLCAAVAFQAFGQTNSTSSTSPSGQNAQPSAQASSPAPDQPAARKVWTNDDMGELRQDSVISTFKPPNAKPAKAGAKPASPKAKSAQWYQARIAGLQGQLAPINDQIAQLQAALSGETVNSVRKWGGVRPDDWRVELDGLQKKRDGIQAQIQNLRDEARRDGVPPNALP
jgi:hypothetical protein